MGSYTQGLMPLWFSVTWSQDRKKQNERRFCLLTMQPLWLTLRLLHNLQLIFQLKHVMCSHWRSLSNWLALGKQSHIYLSIQQLWCFKDTKCLQSVGQACVPITWTCWSGKMIHSAKAWNQAVSPSPSYSQYLDPCNVCLFLCIKMVMGCCCNKVEGIIAESQEALDNILDEKF